MAHRGTTNTDNIASDSETLKLCLPLFYLSTLFIINTRMTKTKSGDCLAQFWEAE